MMDGDMLAGRELIQIELPIEDFYLKGKFCFPHVLEVCDCHAL
jgi:hypothetical protein